MSFNTEGLEPRDISINIESVLPSLATHLYGDDWRVTMREMLQNCHDALLDRESGSGGMGAPRIDVFADVANGTLTFRDNGAGMTREDVERYLATVGFGKKAEELQRIAGGGRDDRDLLH